MVSTASMHDVLQSSGAASGDPGAVVLEPTRRGVEELERPRFGLGANQRRILAQLDGQRTLDDCMAADPRIQAVRLGKDAARLVAFGLARQVRGELPQELLVAAMNLTARIPLDQLLPLEPERTVMPMTPRVGHTLSGRAPVVEAPVEASPSDKPRIRIAVLLLILAALIAAYQYIST